MKTFFRLFILCLLFCPDMKGTMVINGVVRQADTLEYRKLGPGTVYMRVRLPQLPLNCYVLKIDLNNTYNSVETYQAYDQVGKTEALTNAYKRFSTYQHQCLAGVNANFWIVSGQGYDSQLLGVPHSGSMHAGELITDPNGWNRGRTSDPQELLQEIGFAVIDGSKKVWIDDLLYKGGVSIPSGASFNISNVNRLRSTNQLVFYNSYIGTKTRAHSDEGTEVFIMPQSGQSWGVNKDIRCSVIRVMQNTGGNTIGTGESVLSGTGTAATFLNKMVPGDIITVRMNLNTRKSNEYPDAREMVTGNALVMKNGALTIRNTNESYNSTVYPRTGIGTSADGKTLFLIVIDKKGTSSGASTATMCEILRSLGASDVTSMDGGGSAQMMIEGAIVNNPADGKERAVSNGWLLFNTAPEDNQIAEIAFADYQIALPKFASYTPTILGYNKYGVLINKQVSGCELTLDAGIGSIQNGNMAVLDGNRTSGYLTAKYGNITTNMHIQIEDSQVAFLLDSVILDNRANYPLEIRAISDNKSYPIDPTSLTYQINNPAICRISNGILEAISNGTTKVYAHLGTFKDSLWVKVQIPNAPTLNLADASRIDQWEFSNSSFLMNPTLLVQDDHIAYQFTYASGRVPYFRLNLKQQDLYGLPDTIRVRVNLNGINLSKMIVALEKNNSTTEIQSTYTSIPNEGDYVISIPVSSLLAESDGKGAYPLFLKYINFYLGTTNMNVSQSYRLDLKEVSLIYHNLISGLPGLGGNNGFSIYPNPLNQVPLQLIVPNSLLPVHVSLYNLEGQQLKHWSLKASSSPIQLDMEAFESGIYMLNIENDGASYTTKLIIE